MASKRSTLHITIGTFAALFGVASGILYQYHWKVEPYRPNDVSDAYGFYFTVLSVLFWIAFLVIVSVRYYKNKKQH